MDLMNLQALMRGHLIRSQVQKTHSDFRIISAELGDESDLKIYTKMKMFPSYLTNNTSSALELNVGLVDAQFNTTKTIKLHQTHSEVVLQDPINSDTEIQLANESIFLDFSSCETADLAVQKSDKLLKIMRELKQSSLVKLKQEKVILSREKDWLEKAIMSRVQYLTLL